MGGDGTSWSFCALAPAKVINRIRSPFLVPISFLALRVSRASCPPPSREQEVLRAALARLCPGSADDQEDLCVVPRPPTSRRSSLRPMCPARAATAVLASTSCRQRCPPAPTSATPYVGDLRARYHSSRHPAPAKSPVRQPGYRPPTPAKDPPAHPRPDLTFSLPVQDPAFPTSSSSAAFPSR